MGQTGRGDYQPQHQHQHQQRTTFSLSTAQPGSKDAGSKLTAQGSKHELISKGTCSKQASKEYAAVGVYQQQPQQLGRYDHGVPGSLAEPAHAHAHAHSHAPAGALKRERSGERGDRDGHAGGHVGQAYSPLPGFAGTGTGHDSKRAKLEGLAVKDKFAGIFDRAPMQPGRSVHVGGNQDPNTNATQAHAQAQARMHNAAPGNHAMQSHTPRSGRKKLAPFGADAALEYDNRKPLTPRKPHEHRERPGDY